MGMEAFCADRGQVLAAVAALALNDLDRPHGGGGSGEGGPEFERGVRRGGSQGDASYCEALSQSVAHAQAFCRPRASDHEREDLEHRHV